MKYADDIQAQLYTRFSDTHFLGDAQRCDLFMQWITFFRRNLARFVQTYLGINLYWYQCIILHLLSLCTSFIIIGARAIAKSFIIAIYACSMCILYPGYVITIASGTKGQSRLIIDEKIKRELMPKSATLRNEIADIKDNQYETIVIFKNGSRIRVVPANDNARGSRSHCNIYEETRMIKKHIIDSVLSPFLVTWHPDCVLNDPYYHDVKELYAEPREVSISSAWFCNHWMWDTTKITAKDMFNGKPSVCMGFDLSITLKHGIKTRAQLIREKKKFDPMTWAMEYENAMIRENTSAFFTYDVLNKRQVLKKAIYPRRLWDNKVKFGIPKQTGEIRLVSCDIAMIDRKENDNSITSCLRLLPEKVITDEEGNEHVEYRIQIPYIEHSRGGETLKQATRIKQLYTDFDADYCVLDVRSFGISVYDMLAKTIYDEERDIEYKPWICMNDDTIADRVKNPNAIPVLYAFTGTSKRNSEMAVNMLSMLRDGKIDLLISHNEAMEEVLPKINDYSSSKDPEEQLFFENPYLETMNLINEMASLQCERSDSTGIIRLSEKSTEMKDRYVSVAMGCFFASELERDDIKEDEELVIAPTIKFKSCVSYLE